MKIKILSLNTWGGRITGIIDFLRMMGEEVDIICLQETTSKALPCNKNGFALFPEADLDLLGKIKEAIPNFSQYFFPCQDGYGAAILKNDKSAIKLISVNEVFVYKEKNWYSPEHQQDHGRNLCSLFLHADNKTFAVYNLHGLWNGKGKEDAPEKTQQSLNTAQEIYRINLPSILCTDLNLNPDTKGVRIIESIPMVNHIKLNNIEGTRTPLYTKEERYADYIFTSPGIEVISFEVLKNVVSDHCPLLIEIDI